MVWTGVPSREYLVKDPEKGHDNESDQGQVSYDDDGNITREQAMTAMIDIFGNHDEGSDEE